MTRTARPVLGSIVAAIMLVVVIVSCGSTATPAPPTPPAGGATPAGGVPNASDPLGGLGGLFGSLGLGGSFGIGNLLHGAPDLEAILPAQMCGAATLKLSFGGASFGAAAGQIPAFFGDFVGTTGKSMADFSFATASAIGATGTCPDISAFKVNGLDETSLQGFFNQLSTSDGKAPTPGTVGGKAVIKTNDGKVAYFKGDTVFQIDSAPDDAQAAAIALLP